MSILLKLTPDLLNEEWLNKNLGHSQEWGDWMVWFDTNGNIVAGQHQCGGPIQDIFYTKEEVQEWLDAELENSAIFDFN